MTALVLAIGAGLVLADGSVVVLALPELLAVLDTTVEGVAAVIGVYTAVLAIAVLPSERLRERIGNRRAGLAGFALFGAASMGCGLAGSLSLLLVLRGLQALGGALVLVAAFTLLDAGRRRAGGARLWTLAVIGGTAAGPALGGALTQALDWRAIFLAQVPLALAGAVACARVAPDLASPARSASERPPLRFAAALALVSAALTAVLFLLVLVLVAGWSVEPLAAAAAVTVLPLAALASSRIGGDARTRAAAGCALVAGGVAALAAIGSASVWWMIAPQLLAGVGMGLALPALGGELLPERNAGDAARVLTLRHAGIALALAALAPVISDRLDAAVETARERGVALVLDARIDPERKLALAPALVGDVNERDARGQLERSFDEREREFDEGDQRLEFERLRRRADETLTTAVGDGFRLAFLLTAAFALLAAVALLPVPGRRTLAVAGAAAVVVPLGSLATSEAAGPEPVEIANPCRSRELPGTGGVTGAIQDVALMALDRAACRFGSSREELVLALADDDDARRYERRHGVDPRSALQLIRGVLGG